MVECQNYGGHITDRFRRVLGNNDGDVYGCRECIGFIELINGAAVEPDD